MTALEILPVQIMRSCTISVKQSLQQRLYNTFASTHRDYQMLAHMLKFISSWLNVKLATAYKRLGSNIFSEKNK